MPRLLGGQAVTRNDINPRAEWLDLGLIVYYGEQRWGYDQRCSAVNWQYRTRSLITDSTNALHGDIVRHGYN